MSRRRKAPVAREAETVQVDSLSHDGRGVARVDGKVVFVDGALPGETVRMVRFSSRRSHDQARVEAVLEPSPDRVEPRCDHFGVCGGCVLQHLAPAAQLRHKQTTLLDNLQRIGAVRPERVLDPITGPVWGYRRRARLGARDVPGKGRVLVGFRERYKPYVADMHRCEVLAEPAGGLVDALSELIGSLSIRREVPQIEVAVTETVTALVLRNLSTVSQEDFALLRRFQTERGVRIYLQPAGLDSVRPLDAEAGPLSYTLFDAAFTLAFEPTDFIQINAAVNEGLVHRVLELLALDDTTRVLELFCGLGNFSLPVAARAGALVAVEGDAGLVARARGNAEANGIDNVTWHTADLLGDIAGAAWLAGSYSHLLLDPPRSGAGPIVGLARRLGVRRIVYVSCHPGTLARDAGILCSDGYRLSAAGVADMFPHTAHVESVALFEAN